MEEDSSANYSFNAIRGMQATRVYYVIVCPLKIIPKMFRFSEYEISAKLRAQRIPRPSRIPALKNYILSNPDEYIFSSLTASVDGKMRFIPAPHLGPDGHMGRLHIDMNATFLINDGQHRQKAIEEALKERPELGAESISVVFLEDRGLKRSQQMFADLNKNAVKPSKSLNILYDNRDRYSQFIVEMAESLEIFRDRVEFEKTTIGKHAREVFTLGGISDASKKILGKESIKLPRQSHKDTIREYWKAVSDYIPEWQLLIKGDMNPDEMRDNYVNAHTNCLNSLGYVGRELIRQYPNGWKRKLRAIAKIDWSRSNRLWEGNLVQGGKMVRTTIGLALGACVILEACGAEIPKDLARYRR